MEETLRDIVLLFFVAGLVLFIFHRLRLPAVVGLLVAGVLIGPHGFGVLNDHAQIEQLAELGILLLMFSIGLGFSPDRVHELARAAGMGFGQMLICIVGAMAVTLPLYGWAGALFLGFLVAHTSSTLMLKLFLDRGEINTPPVRLGLGISITQDLAVVPMLLAVPLMAGDTSGFANFGFALLKVAGVLAVLLGLARWVIPHWLHLVISSRNRELYLIFIILLCLGTAWATLAAGLPVSLGAFLAGLAVAASRYSHQTLAEIVPFRDLLVSLFFVSIGMLVDVQALGRLGLMAALIVLGVLLLKYLSGFVPVLISGYPLRIATLVGLSIAQVGEFSFVLAHTGHENRLISTETFQLFVLVALITMIVNPFLVARGTGLARALGSVPWLRRLEQLGKAEPVVSLEINHVLVAGYGLNGRTVAQALESLAIPHAVLDLDPSAVQLGHQQTKPIRYGDCTRAEVLRQSNIQSARVYIVAISDTRATRQTVQVARHLNPRLRIIVRTKYRAEIEALQSLGADEVISEEFEASLEILTRVLLQYEVNRPRIEAVVQHFRADGYEAFRHPTDGEQA